MAGPSPLERLAERLGQSGTVTPRDLEYAILLAAGFSSTEIAERMHLSNHNSLDQAFSRIRDKVGVENNAGLLSATMVAVLDTLTEAVLSGSDFADVADALGLPQSSMRQSLEASLGARVHSAFTAGDEPSRVSRSVFPLRTVWVQADMTLLPDDSWQVDTTEEVTVNEEFEGEVAIIPHFNREAMNSGSVFVDYSSEGRLLSGPPGVRAAWEVQMTGLSTSAVDMRLVFSRPLRPGEVALYHYSQHFRGTPTTRAELEFADERLLPHQREGVIKKSWTVIRETTELRRTLTLPPGYGFEKMELLALLDGAVSAGETRRAAEHFTIQTDPAGTVVSFRILEPLFDCLYRLQWRPLG